MRVSVIKAARYGLMSLALAVGTTGAVMAQDDTTGGANNRGGAAGNAGTQDTRRDDRGFDWGWVGLLGLAGLFGLMGRRDNHRHNNYSGNTTTRTHA
jgi:hypothetical protein